MKKKLLITSLLFTIFLLFPVIVQAPDLCSYRGYANKSGTSVTANDTISVTGAEKPYNATIFSNGSYTLDVQKATGGASLTFKICGVSVAQGAQTFGCDATTLNRLNLSITSLANDASCSFSCGCSGGYCCSGGTEYTAGEGTGTCQASACSAATTTTVSAGGGGGGGAVATTTTTAATTTTAVTTTTTTLPPVIVPPLTIPNITPEQSEVIEIPNSDDAKIESIEIAVVNSVSNVEVAITKTSTAPATVAISAPGNVFAYFTIEKKNIEDEDISNVKIKFKVDKSWISDNSIDTPTITLKKYVDGSWQDQTTTLVSEDDNYVYFEAISLGLSVFAVAAKSLPPTTTLPATTTTTVPSILPALPDIFTYIIAIIAIVAFLYWYSKSRAEKKEPWKKYWKQP